MNYEAVVGLEIHAQMLTDTKIFCGCSTVFGSPPNTQTCPICIGMPGVLPVLNKKAVEFIIKTGLALNCHISDYSRFARKNYFYPDLPKNYQISQYELPICQKGYIDIYIEGSMKRIGITRIHLEEDAGKNIHATGNYSAVDLNRAGVPLMEIVTEPDIRSPKEASEFMRKLRTILRYLDVCDGNMEQGSLRCDANVSVRPKGESFLGTKTEIKNINSFKFVEKAIEYEIKRQISIIQDGGKVIQETRLWDPNSSITVSMRSKEEAHDYRYFPEPDLPPLVNLSIIAEEIKKDLPELPDQKRQRFIEQYKIPDYDVDNLVSDKSLAKWFEEAVDVGGHPKAVANWILSELLKLLNSENKSINDSLIKPKQLVSLLKLIENETISGKIAKVVFEEMYKTGKDPEKLIEEKGLFQIKDEDSLIRVIDEVIFKNPKELERFKAGEEKLFGYFVGQIMKETKGKANPKLANELLRVRLKYHSQNES
ncbi:MAG: Asp-tRNA(Asn)/Glu-tRNA(Gln) amidotransferase subunit GatB [Thermodesulfovibrionales bacterium]|nr:Asp-tRNA(Asn)/Glu-tRNA(Gln) amidotransferase subunit GatB [Thermodesulfovibrionales bacterium]